MSHGVCSRSKAHTRVHAPTCMHQILPCVRVQYGRRATWSPGNMATMQNGHRAIWQPCSMAIVQYGHHACTKPFHQRRKPVPAGGDIHERTVARACLRSSGRRDSVHLELQPVQIDFELLLLRLPLLRLTLTLLHLCVSVSWVRAPPRCQTIRQCVRRSIDPPTRPPARPPARPRRWQDVC